jgi:hypothetical protein
MPTGVHDIFVKRIENHVSSRGKFAIETTLSSRTYFAEFGIGKEWATMQDKDF